jgi:antitoxin component YwqK of YwqJK toxin-antitoxin module
MTKIIITTVAAAFICAASCGTSGTSYENIKLDFDSHVSKEGEGGYRGAYMTRHNGEKLQVGEWIYWYPNAQKKLRAYYKLGTPHGHWLMWDEAGTLRLEGHYRLGKGVGKWTAYYSTGQKQHEGRFDNDVEIGHWTFWYLNGNKRMDGNFKYGQWHGDWTFYVPNGAVAFIAKYKNGRLISRRGVGEE